MDLRWTRSIGRVVVAFSMSLVFSMSLACVLPSRAARAEDEVAIDLSLQLSTPADAIVPAHVESILPVTSVDAVRAAVAALAAQETPTASNARSHDGLEIGVSLGFTLDPDLFLIGLRGEGFLRPNLSTGPLVRLGFDDDWTLIAPTWDVKFFPLTDGRTKDDLSNRLFPFIEGGIGFLYAEKDRDNRGDVDDIGLLFSVGGGLDIVATENIVVSTGILLDLLPFDVADENVMLSFQLIGVQIRF